ncbi:MAG: Hint domain-containing protein [Candidatus Pacearchaeota archaeon]
MINKKALASSQVFLLVFSIVAFAYMIGVAEGKEENKNKIISTQKGITSKNFITLANLQTKSISEIKPGDEVLSYDFEKRALTKEVVRDVIVSKKYSYLRINEKLEITPNHEVLLNGKWQPLGNAKVGDYFFGIDGKKVFIEKIELVEKLEGIEVYDLDLGGKWYFAEGVLVHNIDQGPSPISTATQGRTDLKVNGSDWGSPQQESRPSLPPGDYEAKKIPLIGWGIEQGTLGGFAWAGYHLVEGAVWGVTISQIVVPLFGGLFGFKDKEEVEALQQAVLTGMLTMGALKGIMNAKWFSAKQSPAQILGDKIPGDANFWGKAFPVMGAALVAWLVYTKEYKKIKVFEEQVEFKCLPWQAPRGGDDCELCNSKDIPCSEYRCKSLGQTCELVNKGTGKEMCVDTNIRDTNPPIISPWEEKISRGYKYNDVRLSPPGPGFKIIRTEGLNPCIEAFTPIEFGIKTNEPSQCKIDIEKRNSFEEMLSFIGDDNTYRYNFTQIIHVPRAKDFANSSINLEMGNEMTLFVMCRDARGNVNQAPYAIRFCVDDAPDRTPPQIKAVSIESGSCVAANQNSSSVEFYTNEPAECRWDFTDKSFELLSYNMSCSEDVFEINSLLLYTCRANLTGIKREGSDYFIRCKDRSSPDSNVMQQSFRYSLRGSNPLKIKSVYPDNTTLYGGVSPMPVELKVETLFGCDDNKAVCFYSPTGNKNSFVAFFNTNKADGISTQRLDLFKGKHKFYIRCVDAGGNLAETQTEFELDIDTSSPTIARVYYQDDYLKIFTFRETDCVYSTESCDYLFQEGINIPLSKSQTHFVAFDTEKTYYIKCRDEFRNEPVDCSLIVRPKKSFLP